MVQHAEGACARRFIERGEKIDKCAWPSKRTPECLLPSRTAVHKIGLHPLGVPRCPKLHMAEARCVFQGGICLQFVKKHRPGHG